MGIRVGLGALVLLGLAGCGGGSPAEPVNINGDFNTFVHGNTGGNVNGAPQPAPIITPVIVPAGPASE